MTSHQQNSEVSQHLLIAEPLAILIAGLQDQPQHVTRWLVYRPASPLCDQLQE